VAEGAGASVRVMAGSVGSVTGPIKMRNPGLLLDVRLQPGAVWTQVSKRGCSHGTHCCWSPCLSPLACTPAAAGWVYSSISTWLPGCDFFFK
jgi:hypothetical protein